MNVVGDNMPGLESNLMAEKDSHAVVVIVVVVVVVLVATATALQSRLEGAMLMVCCVRSQVREGACGRTVGRKQELDTGCVHIPTYIHKG